MLPKELIQHLGLPQDILYPMSDSRKCFLKWMKSQCYDAEHWQTNMKNEIEFKMSANVGGVLQKCPINSIYLENGLINSTLAECSTFITMHFYIILAAMGSRAMKMSVQKLEAWAVRVSSTLNFLVTNWVGKGCHSQKLRQNELGQRIWLDYEATKVNLLLSCDGQ